MRSDAPFQIYKGEFNVKWLQGNPSRRLNDIYNQERLMAPLTNGRKKINGQRGIASFSLDKEACRAENNEK